jgi:drug/metabolite transporter (DMT)-like permease
MINGAAKEEPTSMAGIPLTAGALLVFLCFLWGGNAVSIKISNQGIPPFLAAALRSAVACLFLWVYTRKRRVQILLPRKNFLLGVIIGILFGLEMLFLYWGVIFTHASRAVIFIYAYPFLTALGAHFLFANERLNMAKVAGLLLAFTGLFLVFGSRSATLTSRFWAGDLMELTVAILWAAKDLYIKKIAANKEISPFQILFAQLLFSVFFLGPAAFLFERGRPLFLTAPVLIAFAYQCLIVAFFSYLLWLWMIYRFPVSRLAAFTFLAPLFGVILSLVCLKESIPLVLWFALALVAGGIYLVNRPGKAPIGNGMTP